MTATVWMLSKQIKQGVPVFVVNSDVPVTVVVDPGHGGEDGGAVSAGGVLESHINLAVAARVNDLLRFSGQRTVMTEPRMCLSTRKGTRSGPERPLTSETVWLW